MALNNIKQLLEKYENAETTLKEEVELKRYFANSDIPQHLRPYQALFRYTASAKQESYTKEMLLPNYRKKAFSWITVAAVAVIALGVFFQMTPWNQKTNFNDLSQEELLAYHQTIEVFSLVSSKLNQGTTNVDAFKLVSAKLNEGAENLNYLKEFQNRAKKIIKNN